MLEEIRQGCGPRSVSGRPARPEPSAAARTGTTVGATCRKRSDRADARADARARPGGGSPYEGARLLASPRRIRRRR